jgi:hypothetical protein
MEKSFTGTFKRFDKSVGAKGQSVVVANIEMADQVSTLVANADLAEARERLVEKISTMGRTIHSVKIEGKDSASSYVNVNLDFIGVVKF